MSLLRVRNSGCLQLSESYTEQRKEKQKKKCTKAFAREGKCLEKRWRWKQLLSESSRRSLTSEPRDPEPASYIRAAPSYTVHADFATDGKKIKNQKEY
jgi:hypothetical protein